jgi:uncharacterized phiE125 gp8 family phage protein
MSWLPVTVSIEPASEPVTSAEVKAQTRIDGTDSDTWITRAITAARILIEQFTGSKIITQTVVMKASDWCDLYDLPIAPIASVSSITYLDADGNSQTLSTDIYEAVLVGLETQIRLKINQSWPAIRYCSDAITVTAIAGAASASEVVKQAILVTIAAWYDDRTTTALPEAATNLLSNSRRF